MRKLAAIMFTDIAGYTALMGEDESKALRILQKNRDFLKPLIERHNGEWLKEMGDGTLSCFTSAVDAVNCAREIQRTLLDDPDLTLRIGIHIGDVVFEGGDVFGDGVNVASRIEPLAEPGGICISGRVHDDIQNKPDIETVFIGEQTLKHVKRPIKVYALAGEGLPTPLTETLTAKPIRRVRLPLISRWRPIAAIAVIAVAILIFYQVGIFNGGTGDLEPRLGDRSVAVLPFLNLSDNRENDYFSDGVTEEILTHLSKIAGLNVVSRTSIMQYKDTDKSIRQIAKELGVAAILEGSVRRAGETVRITGQLIDARTDRHLWADNYDRQLTDIFAIQSDVALRIADAMDAVLTPEEYQAIEEQPTDNDAAYDYYLKGIALVHRFRLEPRINRRKVLEGALEMYEKAVEADPNFLVAYGKMTKAHMWMYWPDLGVGDLSDERLAMAKKALDNAQALDSNHPETHLAAGWYYYHGFREYETALAEFTLAYELQPNNADILAGLGYVQRRAGMWEQAAENLGRTAELDPLDYVRNRDAATTYMRLRSWAEATLFNSRCLLLSPEMPAAHEQRIEIILRSAGDVEQARTALTESLSILGPDALKGWRIWLYILERRFEEAFELERSSQGWFETKAWLASTTGRIELARTYYDSLRSQSDEILATSPDNRFAHRNLGIAYAGLDRREDAIREGKLSVRLMPISRDAFLGASGPYKLAKIYLLTGDYDEAVDQLEIVVANPSVISAVWLRIDPTWDPLRDEPRFQTVLEKYK
jgi:TolB-like protein/class 3 adenylate cyclase